MKSSYSKGFVFVRPHETIRQRRFQKTPLWGPFPKTCVFVARRLRVEGRLKGRKKIPVFKYIRIRVDGTKLKMVFLDHFTPLGTQRGRRLA